MKQNFTTSAITSLTALIAAATLLCSSGCATRCSKPPAIHTVSEAIRPYIEQQEISGAVAMVVTPDQILHLDTLGMADIANQRPATPDTLYWIASMTKPVVGVAIMMLHDEGKLNITDPASRFIPELANLKTRDGKSHTITLHHLLTHTSGLAENSSQESGSALTLAELVPGYSSRPLQFVPGSKWSYSQSGINALGRIVEIISGQPLPVFLEQRIFQPLGMVDTTFYPDQEQCGRLALPYHRQENATLKEVEFWSIVDPYNHNHFPAANGGLYSTAPDYARFCQMLLNNGTLNQKKILTPQAVAMLRQIHSGDLIVGFTPGNSWGLSVGIVRQPQGVTAMLSPGTYGHGGAFGTQAWIDPIRKRAYILMVQRSNFNNADNSNVRRDFQQAAVEL